MINDRSTASGSFNRLRFLAGSSPSVVAAATDRYDTGDPGGVLLTRECLRFTRFARDKNCYFFLAAADTRDIRYSRDGFRRC